MTVAETGRYKNWMVERWTRRLAVAAVLVGVVAQVPFAHGAASDTQKLYVTFELTQTFRVTLPDGTPVGASNPPGTTITPGTYELIFDNSTNVKNLNFQITGPNVSLQEDMGGGEESSAGDYVTFLPSSQYRYHDGNNSRRRASSCRPPRAAAPWAAPAPACPGRTRRPRAARAATARVVGSKGCRPPPSSGRRSPFAARCGNGQRRGHPQPHPRRQGRHRAQDRAATRSM